MIKKRPLFFYCFLLLIFALVGCGKVTTVTNSSTAKSTYEAVLATLSATFEDLEWNPDYRLAPASGCFRALNCDGADAANPKIVSSLASCSSVPGTTSLTGTITITIPFAMCATYTANSTPASNFSSLITYADFTRVDSTGSTAVTIPSGITGVYSATSDAWQVMIPEVRRQTTSSGGSNIEDFTIFSTTNVASTGRRSSGTRTISAGVLTVDDAITTYIYTVTLSNLQWATSTCCYPTSGSLDASIIKSSTVTETETLTFSTTCGRASLVDNAGKAATITLTRGCD